jgi:DNA repair photolyase
MTMTREELKARIEQPRGRGAAINPPNRFTPTHTERDFEQVEHDEDFLEAVAHPKTEYLRDVAQTIVSSNDSPDIPFRFSINPYRGCSHGCSYCYARPTHEYIGLSGGLDFETKIFVKEDAPTLLRDFLARDKWVPEPIVMSGVTDPYQPAEKEFRITRGCLEVMLEARQPVGLITKNALILRDLDLLKEMAALRLVQVSLSITTLDAELARELEPRTSSPNGRLRAVRELSEVGVPVRVMTAPIIPGLNDSEIPALLQAVAEAGALSAAFTILRLPWSVRPVFLDWLARMRPLAREKVEQHIRDVRGGQLNATGWGERMRGTGVVAEQIAQLYKVCRRRAGLERTLPAYDCTLFRRPQPATGQMRLL